MKTTRRLRKTVPATLLGAALVVLPAVPGYGTSPRIECEATIHVWREDVHMRQYMNDYECTCSNGDSSPPVCTSKRSGAAPSGGRKGISGTDAAVLKTLQDYMDAQFKVNRQIYEKYRQTAIENSRQTNRVEQSALRSEEARRKKAAQEEAAIRNREDKDLRGELLGMPAEQDGDALDLTGALDEDAQRRQRAQCERIVEKITRFEGGIRHIDTVMAQNERFIREAEENGKQARADLSKVSAEATAVGLTTGLEHFVQTTENLRTMKKALDKLQSAAGKGGGAGELSPAQIEQAKKWLENGLKYSQDVTDLTRKSIEYYNAPLPGGGVNGGSPFGEQLKSALKDFNDKFMYDAGGWEFVGEHLAEAGGGVGGKIAFQAAVAGIKATAAAVGMKISADQLRIYHENQDKMIAERAKLERKVATLKASLADNRCI